MNKDLIEEPQHITKKKNKLTQEIIKFVSQHLKSKLKSPNQITLEHYAQYIAHSQKNRRIRRFSKRFLNKLPSLNMSYSELSLIICSIEDEDYSSFRKIVLNKDKLSFYCWVSLTSIHKMLVGVYFKTLEKEDSSTSYQCDLEKNHFLCAQKTIKYYDVTTEDQSSFAIEQNWNEKIALEKYPVIEYDSNGLLQKTEMLFKSIDLVDPFSDSPQSNLPIQSKKHLYSLKIKKEIHYELNDPNDFERSEINSQVLDHISYCRIQDEISEIINKNHLQMILSRQEKFLVESHVPFVLSGRPGTGKTTVILFKIFASFFNLQSEKSILKHNEIAWDYITLNLEKNALQNQFRVVYSSLSQDLCDKVQEMYSNILLKEKIEVGYKPIQRKEFSSIHSFRDVKTYPLFVSFRKIIFLIDGSLTHQFFSRTNLRKFEQANADCQINYKRDLEYTCNNYINTKKEEEIKVNDYLYRSPELDEKKHTISRKECGPEEFNTFYNDLLKKANQFKVQPNAKANEVSVKTQILYRILPNIKKLRLTSAEIYAQIYSVIKGSLFSYLSPRNAITREEYNQKGKKLTEFEEENEFGFNERDLVYDIFILYEEHKRKYCLFDIQDFVNHLIRQVKIEFKDITIIDYLFLDEIQDLTINQIYLLVLVSRYPTVFAGDTCQTISESNRFRFTDLKSTFYLFEQIIPNYPHVEGALLNINYRLNASLLKLTTFFANIIKQMFPNTVDKFADDYSVKITPFQPSVLKSIDSVIKIIEGKGEEIFKGQHFTFSYYHCFICRNIEQAKQLSSKYKDLIFTTDIQRCKGLEFEIVIVYNFFTTSKFKEVWASVFNHLGVCPSETSLQNLSRVLFKEDLTYVIENMKKFFPNLAEATENEIITSIVDCHKDFVFPKVNLAFKKHSLFEFCAELKQFYVIITRAQTFMLFYEEDNQCSFISFTTKHKLIESNDVELIAQMKSYFNQIKLAIGNKEELIDKANKEFKDLHYSKAAYLFKIAEEHDKALEAEIYDLNEETKKIDSNQKDYFLNYNYEIIDKIRIIKHCFRDPLGIEGQALTNLGKYEEAIASYEKNDLHDKSGYVYLYLSKDYLKAFEVYHSLENFKLCVTALELGKYYRKLYKYLGELNQDIGVVEFSTTYRANANLYLRSYQLPNWKLNDIHLKTFLNEEKKEDVFPRFNEVKGNINEIICNFVSNYNNMLSKLSKLKYEDFTYSLSFTPSSSNKFGYEKEYDRKKVDELLKDFWFEEDIQRMINTYLKRKEESVILSIIELIPEIFYTRSDAFNGEKFDMQCSKGPRQDKSYIRRLYLRVKNGIEVICKQAGINELECMRYTKEVATYSGIIKRINYTNEQNYILSSLLLKEKHLNIVKMTTETDLTKALYLNALYRSFIFNLFKKNTLSKDITTLEDSIDLLNKSLSNSTLISKKQCKEIKIILEQLLIYRSDKQIVDSFNSFLLNFFQGSYKYSISEYVDLMTHLTCISIFLYSSNATYIPFFNYKQWSVLIALAKQVYLFNEKVFNYSGANTLSNILLFTLFSPFGISYCSKITTLVPINLYQDINMCLINKSAFNSSFNFSYKTYLLINKNKGVFDSKRTHFLLKFKTALKLYREYQHSTLTDLLMQIFPLMNTEAYEAIPRSISTISSLLTWQYSLYNFHYVKNKKKKPNAPYLLQLFEKSIHYPSQRKENFTPSVIFHFLLHILCKTPKESKPEINNSCTFVYYLCYKMKAKLDDNFFYAPKLNLYLLLMILNDSYGITFEDINKRFIFEGKSKITLLFYKNSSLWSEILSLLQSINYSPMIVLIWIKKITYQLIAFLVGASGKENVVVYDMNKVLTTCKILEEEKFSKVELNEAINSYFTVLNYFISNFISSRKDFEVQFYSMNIYCIFLSFLGLMKSLDLDGNTEGIETKPILEFIKTYRSKHPYCNTHNNSEEKALQSPSFSFFFIKKRREIDLVKRSIKDLFTNKPEHPASFYCNQANYDYSLWYQPFEPIKSEVNKFLLNKYNNEKTYGEALLAVIKRFRGNCNTTPLVFKDECKFQKETRNLDEDSEIDFGEIIYDYIGLEMQKGKIMIMTIMIMKEKIIKVMKLTSLLIKRTRQGMEKMLINFICES